MIGSNQTNKQTTLEELLSSIGYFLEGKTETKRALQDLTNLADSIGTYYYTCELEQRAENRE